MKCDGEVIDAKGRRKEVGVKGRQKAKRKNGRYMSQGRDKGKPTVSPLVSGGLTNTRKKRFSRWGRAESIVLLVWRGSTVRTGGPDAAQKQLSTASTPTLSLSPPTSPFNIFPTLHLREQKPNSSFDRASTHPRPAEDLHC